MSNIQVISTLEELYKFLNDQGVLEIAQRGKLKRFKEFIKVSIKDLPETQNQDLLNQVIHKLNENINLNELNLKRLGNIARIQNIGLLLNGMNLCATCVGFAIMYAKLDKMGKELSNQIRELQKNVKDIHIAWTEFEFNKVLANHRDMLDSKKRQQPYTEEKMRELVDSEYNVLTLLIDTFNKDISGDKGILIYSIFALLSMFTASLCSFDEVYYFNNHEKLTNKGVWHTAHDQWMNVYNTLSSNSFIEKLQDYATFDVNLTTVGVDVYYGELMQQVSDCREEIENNQSLIIAMEKSNVFQQYKDLTSKDIVDSIKKIFEEAGKGLPESEVMETFEHSIQTAAMI